MKRKLNNVSIELLSCPQGGENCSDHLRQINTYMELARELFESKDYMNSIDLLSKAYEVSYNVSQGFCVKCADLFREIILKALNNHSLELQKLTTGFMARKKYIPVYNFAQTTIKKLQNFNPSELL